MAVPADRFSTARTRAEAELLPLRLPAVLALAPVPAAPPDLQQTAPEPQDADAGGLPGPYRGGPVEFARPVPPSGNMEVLGKQFWLGTTRAGMIVTFWASTGVIHLSIGGARVKSVRSHLSAAEPGPARSRRRTARGDRRPSPPPSPAPRSR